VDVTCLNVNCLLVRNSWNTFKAASGQTGKEEKEVIAGYMSFSFIDRLV